MVLVNYDIVINLKHYYYPTKVLFAVYSRSLVNIASIPSKLSIENIQ